MDYLDVPPEIFQIILSFTDYNTKIQLRYTSRKFFHWVDLKHFVLTYTSPSDLRQIVRKLAKIKKPITIEFNKPLFDSCKDLHPITALRNLHGIKFRDHIEGTEKDKEIFSKLTNLTSWNLRSSDNMFHMPPKLLTSLQNLTNLNTEMLGSQVSVLRQLSKLKSLSLYARKLTNTIFPFSLVATPEMLTKLVVSYTVTKDEQLLTELLVLPRFTRLKYLKLQSNSDPYFNFKFDPIDLQYFGALEQLWLNIRHTGLQFCTRLTSLYLCYLDDDGDFNYEFSSLISLTNVKQLDLLNCCVPRNDNEAYFLQNMTALRDLNLSTRGSSSNYVPEDILLNVTSTDLTRLELDYIPVVFVSHLTGLQELIIREPLRGKAYERKSISFDRMYGLTRLVLYLDNQNAYRSDVFTNLREYVCRPNEDKVSIDFPPKCPSSENTSWINLESLHLGHCSDEFIPHFSSLKKLSSLTCKMNGDCRDYSGFTQLPLTKLDVDVNVSNLRLSFRNAVRKLTTLEDLRLINSDRDLAENKKTVYYILTELVNLRKLYIHGAGMHLKNFSRLTALYSICIGECNIDTRITSLDYLKPTMTRLHRIEYYPKYKQPIETQTDGS